MAKIIDNPNGGRRMIRLTSDDIMMVVSLMQNEFNGKTTNYDELADILINRPFYLPEEA